MNKTRLRIIKKVENSRTGKKRVLCKCVCGTEKIVFLRNLETGNTKSCGCLQKERVSESSYRHGLSNSHFSNAFNNLRSRCENPSNNRWELYGGRGIKCLWSSFEEFRVDMHESYVEHVKKFGQKQTTIDRINTNSHYHKENCRWATYKVQGGNKRDNVPLTYKGQTKNFCEWADELGIKRPTLWVRLFKYGWTLEKALTTPVKK